MSSNEFSNMDEHELSGTEKQDQNLKALDLTHQTNEDDLTPEQKDSKFYRMIYGFNSTVSPKNKMTSTILAGKIADKMSFKSLSKGKIQTVNEKISNYNDILHQRESFQMMSKSQVESTSRSLKSSRL